MIERLPEEISFTDEEGVELTLRLVAHLCRDGHDYALAEIVSEEDEDDGSVTVLELTEEKDGEISFLPLEDDAQEEELFYLLQAEADDYEVGPAE